MIYDIFITTIYPHSNISTRDIYPHSNISSHIYPHLYRRGFFEKSCITLSVNSNPVGKFVKYSKWLDSVYFDGEQYEYPYFTQPIFFDLQTGEYLDWRTLVKEDWLAEQKSDTDKLEGMVLIDVGLNSAYVILTFQESGNTNGQTVNLHVSPEYINW